MADTHSKEVRSKNMSHIRSTNSKPEETVRKYLFSKGLPYSLNIGLSFLSTDASGTNTIAAGSCGHQAMRNTGTRKYPATLSEMRKTKSSSWNRAGGFLLYGNAS